MDQITLKNFRCFRGEHSARLAPLTLLVGENSTGKTSFMAMIRALVDASAYRIPDFKEAPYDLGSFDEIVYNGSGKKGQSETFEAGFESMNWIEESDKEELPALRFDVTFERRGTAPFPAIVRYTVGIVWVEQHMPTAPPYKVIFGTDRGTWEKEAPENFERLTMQEEGFPPPFFLLGMSVFESRRGEDGGFKPLSGSEVFGSEERKLVETFSRIGFERFAFDSRPFASAPVRSKPKRTYDPSRPTPDPEGDNVPRYLAALSSQDKEGWTALVKGLEDFGKSAGLFDEISIRALGKGSDPFQVQIRKYGKRLKGSPRNLSDMGYGVSQVLPIITELLRSDAPPMFLFQQPEVHLHPTAQAALGSLFCQVAEPRRQLIVETHSDHLLDRVRMDVRDGVGGLKPRDVSILFFERVDLQVRIHSLQIDEDGNIVGAPDSYREFFMKETQRSLGL